MSVLYKRLLEFWWARSWKWSIYFAIGSVWPEKGNCPKRNHRWNELQAYFSSGTNDTRQTRCYMIIKFSIPFKSGDILLLDAYIPHYAGDNYSDRPRRALFFSFNRLDDGNFNKGIVLKFFLTSWLRLYIQRFISESVMNQLAPQ